MLPSLPTLTKIAVVGAFVTLGTGYVLQTKYIERYRSKDFYKEALKRLRRSAGAVQYLGEPIRDKEFNVTDMKTNFCDDKEARFKVPVVGTKDRGMYYFWATNVDGKWEVQRAELELQRLPDKRLVVIRNKQETSVAN